MVLEVKEITKSFGEKQVLSGVSFEAQGGKALGLLGRNGAGKTTTIRIIMQVFNANSGEVLLDGKPLDTDKVSIGYMPEERGLYPKKSIMEQLIYFANLKGVSTSQAKENAIKLLEKLEMTEYKNAKLNTLSKGNQQKIQLVATLVCNPDIVILDEPFSGLDPVNAMLLKDIVKELIADGKIVLFSSHQMNYIEEFCDDIVILNKGKVAVSGSIKEIKRGYERNKIYISSQEIEQVQNFITSNISSLIKNISQKDDGLLLELNREDDKPQVLRTLADCSADIDEFKVYEPSLNDIFVDFTEGAI
ncbi:MAG: ATP-binding cassette domain-containing protein [Clostridiales bacterium]|nr:ATP-binding cassette domain-containing protein [Clostridiales bacterium]